VPVLVLADEHAHDDQADEEEGQDAAEDGRVGGVVQVRDLLLVHVCSQIDQTLSFVVAHRKLERFVEVIL
jgi:hypothetical protein